MPALRTLSVFVAILAVIAPLTGATVAADPPLTSSSPNPTAPHNTVENLDRSITILRGSPTLFEDLETNASLTAARENNQLRSPQFLSPGDLLVLQFRSNRLSHRYANTTGDNASVRFLQLTNTTAINFSIERRTGPEQLPTKLDINKSNLKVIHDANSSTFSLLIDTGNARLVDRRDGEPSSQSLRNAEFQAVVEVPREDNDSLVFTGSYKFDHYGVRFSSPDENVQLRHLWTPTVPANGTDNLSITGMTGILPGTTVTVQAVTQNGTVLAAREVEAKEQNTSTEEFGLTEFQTTLSIPDLDADSTFELRASVDGQELASQDVIVGEPPVMRNTSAELVTSGPHKGEIAVTATINIPEPGFLLVAVDDQPKTVSVPENKTVESTVYVSQNAVYNDGMVYVMTMWDKNENRVYESDPDTRFETSADVGASAEDDDLDTEVAVEGWPATTTQIPSITRTSQTISTISGTASTPMTTEPTSTSIPGFGPIIAAISVALAFFVSRRIL